MCGFVGIWRRDGRDADPALLAPMLATIGHRGPDDGDEWQAGRIALGHRRLSIIDLTSGSRQPMIIADGQGALVYNGEVYNFREIRRELEGEGARFASAGDTEVVLQALHRWGVERSLSRFNGMFAFAYFDGRDGTLWLARDRLGIKPIVVAEAGNELLFASEAKAVLAHPGVRPAIDDVALSRFLLGAQRESHRGLFSGIEGVRAGAFWKVTERSIEKRTYFDAVEAVDVARLAAQRGADVRVLTAQFADALRGSVRLHLVSDAPLAAACSGGVDSGLITAFAAEQAPDLKAYVADMQDASSEAPQAERVTRHLGVAIRRVPVDRATFLKLWPLAVWHSDRPSYHPSDPALLAVARACRADGVKVLLTGEGSDEMFGGYPWQRRTYWRWRRLTTWRRFFANPDGRRERRERIEYAPFFNLIGGGDLHLRRRLTAALDSDLELLPRRIMAKLAPIEPVADRAFLGNCLFDLHDHLSWILHRHDRIGMAASIEMRVPFIENGIIDLALHTPRHAKLRGRTGKWLVRQAAATVLPPRTVYARKKGFPVPESFTRGCERLLSNGALAEKLHWSKDTNRAIIVDLASDGFLRYQLVGLEMWLRIFFSNESTAQLQERLMALVS